MNDCVHSIAAAFDESTIKIFDLRTLGALAVMKEKEDSVNSIAFSLSNRFLFSSYKEVSIWDVLREEKISSQQGPHNDLIKSLSLSKDGSLLASVSKDGKLQIWNP